MNTTELRAAAQHAATACNVHVGAVDVIWSVDTEAEAYGTEPAEWCVRVPVKLHPRRKSDTRWTSVRGYGATPMQAATEAISRHQEHMSNAT